MLYKNPYNHYFDYVVQRDMDKCIRCKACVTQCSYGANYYDEDRDLIYSLDHNCVGCMRCSTFCPTDCISIVRNPDTFRLNANWKDHNIKDLYKQACTGGIIITGMGNDKPFTNYWEHMVIDACQVTNPSIDPLREPMELKTFLGRKPDKLEVDKNGDITTKLAPQLVLDTPIMFSAMSYGSINYNVCESVARASKQLGIFWNTGEGGLPRALYEYGKNTIVQCASGRFGVSPEYLNAGAAIEIKIGQGAKPGIGGHLPGEKVLEGISETRLIPIGTDAISPAPHHDIYSIEDLAQLIHDLKNVNPQARISVKLVSEVGVGTVAAGVAKAHADHVTISGHDGGTGASPLSSIKYAGSPWELGLAETQQTLVLNRLRGRICVQADGQMKTGRDVVIGALLGADEFGFATAPLVVEGCIMMRKCHLNTCPVGIATQDPELTRRFAGQPEHVINYFFFVAEEVRELMAQLGFRTFEEMVGRVDRLDMRRGISHWKAQGLDFSKIFHSPDMPVQVARSWKERQDHGLEQALDHELIAQSRVAIEQGQAVVIETGVRNVNRSVGAMLSGEVARHHGFSGLPQDTILVRAKGTAGQSFGAFLAHGVTFHLYGEANDYVGKGLSGGRIIIQPAPESALSAEENIIVGNTVLYGAVAGECYFRGVAGERFAVRNSGAVAVVEGVGDHGCEYMTGGTVVVLGEAGRNFAAGMSGGIAFVYDEAGDFDKRCNLAMVALEAVPEEEQTAEVKGVLDTHGRVRINHIEARDEYLLRTLIENHVRHTGSTRGQQILDQWSSARCKFVKVMPLEYRRALAEMAVKQQSAQVA